MFFGIHRPAFGVVCIKVLNEERGSHTLSAENAVPFEVSHIKDSETTGSSRAGRAQRIARGKRKRKKKKKKEKKKRHITPHTISVLS